MVKVQVLFELYLVLKFKDCFCMQRYIPVPHACVPLRAFATPRGKAHHPRGVLKNMKEEMWQHHPCLQKGPSLRNNRNHAEFGGERCQWPLPPPTDPKLHCLGKKKCTDRPIPQRNIFFFHFRKNFLSREFEGGEKGGERNVIIGISSGVKTKRDGLCIRI